MKHTITFLGCVLLIAAVCVVSTHQYDQYQTKHNAQVAAANSRKADKAASVEKAQASAQAKFTSQVDTLEALCEKDLATYNATAPALRLKMVKPDCALQFAQ